ncbi:hypothetical protein Kisp01_57560 [Kineosporia sp. NBRC 101677]|uniref:IS1096 element passenger TnpR family protein n=1 Tax=Kineosporia sp. NBRC 101677 TaxID=3032197 RepID=UPI0024A27F3D|nr:hypothetical protein [Kineosporia sp. NBRC 101677]GLY18742.1 hypothetical protein Kisp01_57560 [Kineosporia sp. NBRC 101677]
MKTTRLKVTLRDVEPRVLRVLDVPSDSTLGELHDLLQIGLGWLGLERGRFVRGPATYLPGNPEATLADLVDRADRADGGGHFGYFYDPRARWEHDVVVLGPGGEQAGCVYGEGPCPPESTEGPRDYANRRRTLGEDMLELFWAPHGPEFDQALTDLRVRQMAGLVPESVRHLMRLTEGGGLAEPVVEAMHELRPRWPRAAGGSPVTVLHGILRSTGLLGPAGRDQLLVVRRLRSWFAPGTFTASVAGLGVGALAARGALDEETLVGIVFSETDRRKPVAPEDVRHTLVHLLPALTGLDLAERTAQGWFPGPSARSLLPQATALSVYASDPAPLPPSAPPTAVPAGTEDFHTPPGG